jgi:hypothetical protein
VVKVRGVGDTVIRFVRGRRRWRLEVPAGAAGEVDDVVACQGLSNI